MRNQEEQSKQAAAAIATRAVAAAIVRGGTRAELGLSWMKLALLAASLHAYWRLVGCLAGWIGCWLVLVDVLMVPNASCNSSRCLFQ